MPTVLITGANRGLGLEFARQYVAAGWRVIGTTRTAQGGAALAALDGDVEVHLLDINDFDAIDRLAGDLDGTAIDLLINNAGIYGPRKPPIDTIDYQAWAEVLRIDTIAPFKVTAAFLRHIENGDQRKIATMSSKMGSMGDNGSGGSYIYRSAKAALNAQMKSLAIDLAPRGIALAILHPGWVRTDMGGPAGLIDAAESIAGLRAVIDGLGLGNTGRFWNYNGDNIPW